MPGRKFRPNVSRGRTSGPSSGIPVTPTVDEGLGTTPTTTPSSTLVITSPETTPTSTTTTPMGQVDNSTNNESLLEHVTNTGSEDITGSTGPLHNDVVVQGVASRTTWARKKVAPKLPSATRPRKRKESPTDTDDQSKRAKIDDSTDISIKTHIEDDTGTMDTTVDIGREDTNASQEAIPEDTMSTSLHEPHPYMAECLLPIASTIEVSVTMPISDNNRELSTVATDGIHDQDCITVATQAILTNRSNDNDIHEDEGGDNDIHEECEGNDIHEYSPTTTTSSTTDSRSTRSISVTSTSSSVDSGVEPRKRKTGKTNTSPSKKSKTSTSNKDKTSSSSSDSGVKQKKRKTGKRSTSPSKKKSSSSKNKASQFKEAPDRTKMTMQELIYYNPSANPMSVKGKDNNNTTQQDASKVESKSSSPSSSSASSKPVEDDNDGGDRLVPKLKIGMNGCIEIDEQSMVVETTRAEQINYEDVVHEEGDYTMSTSFRSKRKIKKWTKEETNEFYKALSQVGTDFTMMTLILPNRTRNELKNKFKKEEKSNSGRISSAMNRLCSSTRTTPNNLTPTPPTCTLAS